MKKVVFILLVCLLGSIQSIYAQIASDKWQIGAAVGYNDSKDVTDDEVRTIFVVPSVQYFLSKKWAIGVGVGYQQKVSKDFLTVTLDSVTTNTQNILAISPSIRYYFYGDESNGRFWFFGQLGYTFSQFNSKIQTQGRTFTSPETSFSAETSTITFTPGVVYLPAKRWLLEFTLGGISYRLSEATGTTATTTTNRLGFNINGLNLRVGIYYLFGTKKK